MPLLTSPQSLSSGYLINEDYKSLEFDLVEDAIVIDGQRITFAEHSNYKYYRLEDDFGNELSLIRLKKIEIENVTYYSVDKSKSFVQGKGHAISLYEYAFCNLEFPVISDSTQTNPGSYNLWKKFHTRQEEGNYELFVYNTHTGNIAPYLNRNYNDYDIWGWYDDFTEMAIQDPKFLYDGLKLNDISPELYAFLNANIKKVRDRSHIRLIAKKKIVME